MFGLEETFLLHRAQEQDSVVHTPYPFSFRGGKNSALRPNSHYRSSSSRRWTSLSLLPFANLISTQHSFLLLINFLWNDNCFLPLRCLIPPQSATQLPLLFLHFLVKTSFYLLHVTPKTIMMHSSPLGNTSKGDGRRARPRKMPYSTSENRCHTSSNNKEWSGMPES